MITAAILILLFVVCDAIQDVITFKYEYSVFRNLDPMYFNPAVSWRNKYKDGNPVNGERFFGSTTFLVWLTDFWHLLKFIKMNCVWVAISVLCGIWWVYLIGMILHGVVFEITYRLAK